MAFTRQQQQLAAILKTQLSAFGFDASKYIDQAIRSGVNDIADYAYTLIIHSPEFKAAFPGILDSAGRLRVSPQEYLSRAESFSSTAAQYGFGLTKAQIGGLVQNNVDPTEFQTRAAGIQAVRTNPEMISYLNQQIADFNRYRSAHHQALVPSLKTFADAVNFMTGRSDAEVYQAYEGALFQSQAKEAGIALTSAKSRALANQTPGVLSVDDAQKRFSTIAAELRDSKVDLNEFGLGTSDLLTIEFGGTNREALAAKAEQALAQAKANAGQEPIQQSVNLDKQGRPVLAQGAPAAS